MVQSYIIYFTSKQQQQQNLDKNKAHRGGRWEGGSGMGNTCTPMAYSCQCMAKPL